MEQHERDCQEAGDGCSGDMAPPLFCAMMDIRPVPVESQIRPSQKNTR
ncbi:MAG: hypothetical protein U0N63_03050 [Senegalimassilia anaerobia]